MNKDFNVYKWRRNYLAENEDSTLKDLLNDFKKQIRGAFLEDGYIKTEDRSAPGEEEKVRKIFLKHGYILSKVKRIEGEPDERLDMIKYFYEKK